MIARRCSLAGVVLLAACGSNSTGAVEQITPTSGNEAVINCLVKQVTDMGFRVLRKDPGNGFLEAERRAKDYTSDSPRNYAGGDKLLVEHGKGNKTTRPLVLTMSSFRMDWQANGASQTVMDPTPEAKADLGKLVAACGPNGIAIPAPAAAPGT